MTVLMSIDIGTSNWKVGAFDVHGRLLSLHTTPAVTRAYGPGADYYDPDQLWRSVAGLARRVVADCGTEDIAAVSVTSMAESVVPIDRHGQALFPIIPWFDARAGAEAAQLTASLGAERLFSITGLDPNPIFGLPKMLWIKAHHPDIYARAACWLQMADYIYLKLCGAHVTDYSLASRMQLLDLSNGRWSDELLAAADVPAAVLPEILPAGQIIGPVSHAAGKATGIPTGAPVVVGGHDHLCATLPTGVVLGDKVLDSSGTAEAFIFLAPQNPALLREFRGLRVGSYLDPAYFAFWGGIISSGKAVSWGIERLVTTPEWAAGERDFSYEELQQQAAQAPPGAEGALFLPHLRGSGAPTWNPHDRGAFLGLRATHTDQALLRAIFEGLSCQARLVVETAESLAGFHIDVLSAVGGGTRLPLWQQIKADVTGKTVKVQAIDEATLLGAALLAGVGLGVYRSLKDAAGVGGQVTATFEPNPDNRQRYEALYEIYCAANQALSPLHRRLDEQFGSAGGSAC